MAWFSDLASGDAGPAIEFYRDLVEQDRRIGRWNWLFLANAFDHQLLDRPDFVELNERAVAALLGE